MRGGGVKECAEGLEMAHLVNSKKLKVVGVQGSSRNRQEMKPERTGVLQHGVALHTLPGSPGVLGGILDYLMGVVLWKGVVLGVGAVRGL